MFYSPLDDVVKIPLDEPLVVRLQRGGIDRRVALTVKVIWVKRTHGGQRLLIIGVGEVRVRALAVPSANILQKV